MQELLSDTATFELAQPWWLLLLLVLPVVWWLERRHERGQKGIMFPGVNYLKTQGIEAGRWVRLPYWLTRSAIVLALLAAGRPQITRGVEMASDKGIDIILALDISESMLEEDFGGSRLDAAKDISLRFIRNRPKDRLGLVLFRGKSFTQCPLTLDHKLLGMLVRQVSVDAISDEGTAIGSAILVGTNRLKASMSKEKVMVLITDGENNSGEIGPVTAAEIAAGEGVRIYAIGVGVGRESGNFNAKTLREVARLAGGRYFQVSDKRGLKETFSEIDMLERSRLEGPQMVVRTGLYSWLLFPACIVLFAGLVLGNTRWLRIP